MRIIKITCNGQHKHVNEFDLDEILHPDMILRGPRHQHVPSDTERPYIPKRLVLPCSLCKEGKIVLTREIIEDAISDSLG